MPNLTQFRSFREAVLTANMPTDNDKTRQLRKIHNLIQLNKPKQENTVNSNTANYRDLLVSYDTQPGNEERLHYQSRARGDTTKVTL